MDRVKLHQVPHRETLLTSDAFLGIVVREHLDSGILVSASHSLFEFLVLLLDSLRLVLQPLIVFKESF